MAASVFPWEIAVELPGEEHAPGSAQNRVEAEVASITQVGNRVRLGLAAGQPLAAEVTLASTRRLELSQGMRVLRHLEGRRHAAGGALARAASQRSAPFSTSARSHWRKWPAPSTTNGPARSGNAASMRAVKSRGITWSSGP